MDLVLKSGPKEIVWLRLGDDNAVDCAPWRQCSEVLAVHSAKSIPVDGSAELFFGRNKTDARDRFGLLADAGQNQKVPIARLGVGTFEDSVKITARRQ